MNFTVTATQFQAEINPNMAEAVTTDAATALAQAEAIAAGFPKSLKVYANTCHHSIGSFSAYVSCFARIGADGVNGGRNETGIKRINGFLKAAEKLGHTVTYVRPYSNSITEAEFQAVLAGEAA